MLRFDFRLLCGPSVLKVKSGASSETLVTTYNILWHHTTDHERKNIRAKKKITEKKTIYKYLCTCVEYLYACVEYCAEHSYFRLEPES
jgi:hypothetical protein